MKTLLCLLTFILVLSTDMTAQDRVLDIKVMEGQRYDHLIPDDMKYILPEFQECRFFSRYGEEFTGLINPNFLTDNIYLLTSTGDTLRIAGSEDIVRITAPDRTVLQRDNKFMTVIAEHRNTALCECPSVDIEFFHETNEADEALTALEDRISLNTGSYKIIINDPPYNDNHPADSARFVTVRCTYSIRHFLVIGDKAYPCRLSSFTKAFPERKKAIKDFTKLYYTDFSNRESLIMLFEYCTVQL